MNKLLIPTILAATILVAASFALMPVQKVMTTHLPSVGTANIADGSITTAKIAAGAVTTTEIAADTIAAGDIATGAVGADELAANAVTAAGGELADGVLTADAAGRLKMADGFVNSAKILDNDITPTDLANTLTLDAATSIVTSGTSTLTLGGAGATPFARLIATSPTININPIFADTPVLDIACGTTAVPGVAFTDIAIAFHEATLAEGWAPYRAAPGNDAVEVCVVETDEAKALTLDPDASGIIWNIIIVDLTP